MKNNNLLKYDKVDEKVTSLELRKNYDQNFKHACMYEDSYRNMFYDIKSSKEGRNDHSWQTNRRRYISSGHNN